MFNIKQFLCFALVAVLVVPTLAKPVAAQTSSQYQLNVLQTRLSELMEQLRAKQREGTSGGSASAVQAGYGVPTVKEVSAPRLALTRSGNEETSLTATARITVSAPARQPVYLPINGKDGSVGISHKLYLNKEATNSPNSAKVTAKLENPRLNTTPCNPGQECYLIPAGRTAYFTVNFSVNPLQLFAGSYAVQLSNLTYLSGLRDSAGNYVYTSANWPSQISNSVTVIGEKSPYITGTNSPVQPGEVVKVRGVRMANSKVSFSTQYRPEDIKFSADGTELSFKTNEKEYQGNYVLKLTDPQTGESNQVYVLVEKNITVPGSSNLEISLHPNSPPAQTINTSELDVTWGVNLGVFKIEAKGTSGTLNEVKFNFADKDGHAPSSMFSNLQLLDKADAKVYAPTFIETGGGVVATFSNMMIKLPTSEPAILYLSGDIRPGVDNVYVSAGLSAKSIKAIDANYNEMTPNSWNQVNANPIYFKLNSTNLPPVINKVSGPTTLKAGEKGTWSISATDPENGSLTYSIDWGEGILSTNSLAKISNVQQVQQTSTFTHVYNQTGNYTVKIKVIDEKGLTAESSQTVVVNPVAVPIILDPHQASFSGNIEVKVLNGAARCFRAPCEIPYSGVVFITLYDASGKTVLEKAQSYNASATFKSLKPGAYIVKAEGKETESVQSKVVVKPQATAKVTLTIGGSRLRSEGETDQLAAVSTFNLSNNVPTYVPMTPDRTTWNNQQVKQMMDRVTQLLSIIQQLRQQIIQQRLQESVQSNTGSGAASAQALTVEKILNSNGYVDGVKSFEEGSSSTIFENSIVFGDLDGDGKKEASAVIRGCGASCHQEVYVFKLYQDRVLMKGIDETFVVGALHNIEGLEIKNNNLVATVTDNDGTETLTIKVSFVNGQIVTEVVGTTKPGDDDIIDDDDADEDGDDTATSTQNVASTTPTIPSTTVPAVETGKLKIFLVSGSTQCDGAACSSRLITDREVRVYLYRDGKTTTYRVTNGYLELNLAPGKYGLTASADEYSTGGFKSFEIKASTIPYELRYYMPKSFRSWLRSDAEEQQLMASVGSLQTILDQLNSLLRLQSN